MRPLGSRGPGDRLGPYELVRRLGRGGTGEVWEAVLHGPAGFRKDVALKCLAGEVLADPLLVDALLQEARLGARLQHPNVVATLGVSEHDGTWVIALELVRGASLADLVRSVGPLGPVALLDVGVQAAAGLAHVHDAGLVHRDVKPANLLLDRTGVVKVADLGISVLVGERGALAGTPAYMPPEQAAGRAGPRSDLFSLGASLFLLATGRKPFADAGHGPLQARASGHGGVTEDRLAALLPDLAAAAEAAVGGLGAVMQRCLAVDPADRWPSARVLAEALAATRARHAGTSPPPVALLGRARPGLATEPTPSPTSEAPTRLIPTGNVPGPRDRFVGRADELRELCARVVEGSSRWIVVLGPGGIGKTRLALEAARALRARVGGGAWSFDLSEARSEDGVCAAVARGLGIELEGADPTGQLGRALASKGRALLLLDNLEQCVDHLPATLGRWLDAAPEAMFLGTSRLRPGLRGERALALGPLARPDAEALLVERSRRPLTPEERELVSPLCEALEHVPLAIELAAARVSVLGLRRVSDRLSVRLLAGGPRDRPERHRSLEASLDWSMELLSPTARAGLQQLSVLEGGCSLEAAEAVLDLGGAVDAIAVLQELVDASLLRVDPRGGRFSMLVVVREHAASRAAPADRAAAEVRHGAHFAQLGSRERVWALRRGRVIESRRLLGPELDNLVVACRRAAARGDAAVAVATLRGAAAVFDLEGPYRAVLELAESVLATPGLSARQRTEVDEVIGRSAALLGDRERATRCALSCLEAHRAAGDRRGEAAALGSLGAGATEVARYEEARAHFQEALRISREIGDRTAEGVLLGNLAAMDTDLGRLDQVEPGLLEALAIHREVGDRRSEGRVLSNLGVLLFRRGRLAEARDRFLEALVVDREVGDRRNEAMVLGNLGLLQQELGASDEARETQLRALDTVRELGLRRLEGIILNNLSLIEASEGRYPPARAYLAGALDVHRELGNRRSEGIAIGNLGRLSAREGDAESARARYREALAIHREVGNRAFVGWTLAHHASLELELGQAEVARPMLAEGLRSAQEAGDIRGEAHVLELLAEIEATRDRAAAHVHLDRAEALLRRVGSSSQLAELLARRAELAWEEGDPTRARAAVAEAGALASTRAARAAVARVKATIDPP